MAKIEDVPIQIQRMAHVVAPELTKQIRHFESRIGALAAGYSVVTDWHPVIPPGRGQFAPLPFRRRVLYRGNADTWAYSHHQSIARFKDRYVASWSNGLLHEDYVGQEVHFCYSSDGVKWSEPGVVVPTPVESKIVRTNSGLYATADRLYCYVCVADDPGRDVATPGMTAFNEPRICLDCLETSDLETWTRHERICENIYLFEAPRPTQGGKLLCCGFDPRDHHAVVLVWDDASDPAAPPRTINIRPSPNVSPEQGTWYQTDDGRIWVYQRDSAVTGYLALTWSDDEGETWSELVRTDFPNTYSRAFAGRLHDGRFYIVGNNFRRYLDRKTLLIALSDDGRLFDRQYTLVEGPTTRRVNGRHKEDGYHYPNCLAHGDRLVVVYSVNKEDIEVGIADMSAVE